MKRTRGLRRRATTNSVLERRASTVGELVDAVREIAEHWSPGIVDPQEVWFRGQKRSDYSLIPGLYRPENSKYHYDEEGLFERFKLLATPHVDSRIQSEWDWYFLAQHFGLPTRLLDWTENLLAAAYFALCEGIYCRDRLTVDAQLLAGRRRQTFGKSSPAVWVMDAGTLNKVACGEDRVFSPGLEFTGRYLPDGIKRAVRHNRLPLALLAPRANLRISSQQGVFTVHGRERVGLEISGPSEGLRLARVILDGANLAFFWEELQVCGMSKHALFPSVETAAHHAAWQMQSAMPMSSGSGRRP